MGLRLPGSLLVPLGTLSCLAGLVVDASASTQYILFIKTKITVRQVCERERSCCNVKIGSGTCSPIKA